MQEDESKTDPPAQDGYDPAEPGAELAAAAQAQESADRALQRAAQEPGPVVVFTAESQDEAEIVRGILESEGVPAEAVDQSSPILGDILRFGERKPSAVIVAPSDEARARELIASYRDAAVPDDIAGDAATDT